MANILLNHKIPDDQARQLVFSGTLLLNSSTPATHSLALHAKEMIESAFHSGDPEHAQFSLDVPDFVKIVGPLKSSFTNAPKTKELIRDLLLSFDCNLEDTYF